MIKNYKIIKNTYIDEYGKKSEVFYSVEYKTRFLFWDIWKTVKHREQGFLEDDFIVTKFNSPEQAEHFVQKHILGDKPLQRWVSEEM